MKLIHKDIRLIRDKALLSYKNEKINNTIDWKHWIIINKSIHRSVGVFVC